jgi:thioredoxin reductase (NADPH)
LERLKASKADWVRSSVEQIEGDRVVSSIRLTNGTAMEAEGIFIELGSKGALELATQIGVQLDSESFKYIRSIGSRNQPRAFTLPAICWPPYQMASRRGRMCCRHGMSDLRQEKRKGVNNPPCLPLPSERQGSVSDSCFIGSAA